MNEYEILMNKSDFYLTKAIEFFKKNEISLATFYKNVSECYKNKALKLEVC